MIGHLAIEPRVLVHPRRVKVPCVCRGLVRLGIALSGLCLAIAPAAAVDYTWGSSTTGGSWSVTSNWNPTGAPTSGDTALLHDATANRTVFYDAAASGTLTGLSFTQTSGFLNELWVQRSIGVTNAVTLGASSGTARLLIAGTAATVTGTFAGGVTVNSGGILSLGLFNPAGGSTVYAGNFSGNVTVAGGLFELSGLVAEGTATSFGATQPLSGSGNLTMTSGTINFVNNGNADRRLNVNGNLSVTGGSVTAVGTGNSLQVSGATNVFAPEVFEANKFRIALQRSGDQTLSGSIALGEVMLRGTGVKTVSNTHTVSALSFIDGSTALNSRTTLKLGSDLTSTGAPSGSGFSQNADANGNVEFGIDADSYTLDFSPANAVWTPTKFAATGMFGQVGTIANTVWALTGTAGTIKARGFNFATSGSTTLTTTIGPGLVLEATGASDTNVLSGSGTIDPTSTFRFSGTSTVPGSPATLSSDRALGNLEVTSGALRLGATFTSMQQVRVSGGSLDLLSKSLDVPSVQLTGGTITTGTLTSAGSFDMQAGTLAATLLGSGTLTKSGPGVVVLSGSNGYTGGTTIDSGTLQIGDGGTGSIEGDVTVNGGVLAFGRSDAVTFGGTITGAGGLAMVGAGTTTLTGANAFSGGTTLASGVLALGSADAIGSLGTIDFAGGTLQASAANTTDYSSRFSTAAGQQYRIDTNGQSIQWATGLTSAGGSLTKNGLDTLTLTQDATFSGTTTVNNGTLTLGDGGTTGSLAGPIALTNTTALVVNRSNDLTLGGVISGTGSLTKQGAGTLSLTAANTFVGTTTISAGTLALTGADNRLATTGTVSFAGNGALSVNGSQSLAQFGLDNDVTATLTGGGAVTVTGGLFRIGGTGSSTFQTFDASGLTSFAYANAGGTFKVGGNTTLVGAASGRLSLPAAATITAASVGVGSDSNNAGTSSGTLTLGTTTVISANTITLGNSQAQGTIDYAAGTTNPVLTLRGSNGTSPVTNMTIGTTGGFGQTLTSLVDLTGGVTGTSTLDALVTNLTIGQNTRNSGGNTSAVLTGGLVVGGGTLTSGTITLGRVTSAGGTPPPAGTPVTTGSLSVSGGTVNVGTLVLGDQNWNIGTVNGIFALSGGGTLNAGTIASGTGTGTGAVVRTFQWNDGTIANLDAGTDLTIGSGIAFNLASTGTHRFSIGTGRSGSVASVLAGAGGTLEKTGAGTLTLSANNTYTGATTVSAGTLFVNGDQSAAIGTVTVASAATLAGSGTIGGAVSILGGGIVAPGTSPGTLTVASSFTLADAAILSFELDAQNTVVGGGINDLITGVTDLTLDGILNITGSGDWTTIADNTAWRLFDYSGTLLDNGLVLGSTPTLAAGQSFQIDTATTGQVNLVVVPEPGGLVLLAVGAGIVAWSRRRR
jgi:fibronectin-binding autotransporter adhesin